MVKHGQRRRRTSTSRTTCIAPPPQQVLQPFGWPSRSKSAEPEPLDRQNRIEQLLGSQNVVWRDPNSLKVYSSNARTHPKKQIVALARNIQENGWTTPILIDESWTILMGHARVESAKVLKLKSVPTLTLASLPEDRKKAVIIADNRLAELAVWDMDVLRGEFQSLAHSDFEIDLTGYSTGEVDIILDGATAESPKHDADDDFERLPEGPAVSQLGDVWCLGRQRLFCGDAREASSYTALMAGRQATLIVTDPPYNVRIDGHARGRGRCHREFAMASGEMSGRAFEHFLGQVVEQMIRHSTDGSIHFLFMDWRHTPNLLSVGMPRYNEWKQLLVWNKSNDGQGSFYRSKYELIFVFKNGVAPHINNFGLGAQGRYRANVLDYPGVNALLAKSNEEMDSHPTVKPAALIADLMRDCSRRNDVVLDPFVGSGTVFVAAERTGRIAYGMEIDPLYVDLAVQRWQTTTGQEVAHGATNLTFAQMKDRREVERDPEPRLSSRRRA